MTTPNPLKYERLLSVIAYFAEQLKDEHLGKLKLFKLMFLADFKAMATLGEPITGETYVNFPLGPVPKNLWHGFREIMSVCSEVRKEQIGPYPMQRICPRQDFEVPVDFSEEHEEILEGVVEKYGQRTGTDLTHITHRMIPYRATARYEEIPYGLAGYVDNYRKPTATQARKLLRNTKGLRAALLKTLNAS